MTENEAAKLLYTIKAVYKREFSDYTTQDFKNVIMAWCGCLEDYSYEQASAGLKIFMASDKKGFAPKPGQVIDCIHKAMQSEKRDLNEMEAWALVRRALRNSGYHADEEFAKLPEAVQRAVGSAANLHEWATMQSDEVGTVIQSNFIRTYNTSLARAHEEAKIPTSVRTLIASMMDHKQIAGGT